MLLSRRFLNCLVRNTLRSSTLGSACSVPSWRATGLLVSPGVPFGDTYSSIREQTSTSVTTMPSLNEIKDAEIDDGRFKYILIKATDSSGESKHLVRGRGDCEYHHDIFEKVRDEIGSDIQLDVEGGGKIEHDSSARTINVFGRSTGYGAADHSKAAEVLRKTYPEHKIEHE